MTDLQKARISDLRSQGYGYTTIGKALGLKKETVVAYCRKNGLAGIKATNNSRINLSENICLNCGNPIIQKPGKKQKKFCCDACRVSWWNHHPEKVNRKANYTFTCANCGKEFVAYGNASRKYCSHSCYIAARFKEGQNFEN